MSSHRLDTPILIIGAGGIGSNAAHIAASTGFTDITMCDFDMVGWENIHPGFLSAEAVMSNKARAVADDIKQRLEVDVKAIEIPYESAVESGYLADWYGIVIVSTDNLSTRVDLWKYYREICRDLWIDARMGGILASVYSVPMDIDMYVEQYNVDILSQEAGSTPCGEKATAPLTKGFIAGMIGQSLVDFANSKEPLFFQRYDLGARFMLSYGEKPNG